jgi:hypothetical protein
MATMQKSVIVPDAFHVDEPSVSLGGKPVEQGAVPCGLCCKVLVFDTDVWVC